MSSSNKVKGGYTPVRPPSNRIRAGYTPAHLTPESFMALGVFFKQLLAENPIIKASVIAAGIGGALGALHVLWLAARHLGLCR